MLKERNYRRARPSEKNHTKKPTVGFLIFGRYGKIFNVKVKKHTECVECESFARQVEQNRPPSFPTTARQADSTRMTAPPTDRISKHSRSFAPIGNSARFNFHSRNSLISRIGLLQVVDFHDIFRYFSWLWRSPFAVGLQFLKVQKQLMQLVDFHDSFR